MPLVDTHCHVDLYPDGAAVIAECEARRIATVAVTNAPAVFRACQTLVAGKRYIRPALGLHPELAHQRQGELALFRDLLPGTRFVGEVGLDFTTPDAEVRKAQVHVFEEVLGACAAVGDKVLTVHSRRAAQDVVDRIGANYPARVVLHWFSGSNRVLRQAVGYGCFFSVNPAMIRSESGRRIIAAVPPERVLTESDGPFAVVEGRPTRPTDMRGLVQNLAAVWAVDEGKAEELISRTFRELIPSRAAV